MIANILKEPDSSLTYSMVLQLLNPLLIFGRYLDAGGETWAILLLQIYRRLFTRSGMLDWNTGWNDMVLVAVCIAESFPQDRPLRLYLIVSPLHHMSSMQKYRMDRFWDPLCFWCTSITCPKPPAYKHLTSLIGLMTAELGEDLGCIVEWGEMYHSMLPRPNCRILITEVRTAWYPWRWMI